MEIGSLRATAVWTLAALLAVGAFEQISQVLLIREFFVVFKGNEVSFGVVFAFWMLWTALGSGVAGLVSRRIRRPVGWFCLLNLLLAAFLVVEIRLVRGSRSFFDVPSGGDLDIVSMALFAFVLLAGVCFVGGALFVLGARIYADVRRSKGSEVPTRAYVADSLGCLLGGLVVTFVLVTRCDPFTSAFASAAVLLAATVGLAAANGLRFHAVLSVAALVACTALAFTGRSINRSADEALWRAYGEFYRLVESRNSRYGNLAILGYQDQHSLFLNGELYFTMPDETAPIELANLSVLQHADPKEVLLIGGGVSGLLRGLLRHDPTHIDYVELDPEVIRLARPYLPSEDLAALEHAAVTVHHTDGRLFLTRTDRKYDLVVCDLPDPSTASVNRFYTREFFRSVREVLRHGGVFVTGVSSEGFWETELLRRNRSVFRTLNLIFPRVLVSPGGLFIAAEEGTATTLDAEELVRRFQDTGCVMADFVPEIYYSTLEPDSVEAVLEKLTDDIEPDAAPMINTDAFPVSSYLSFVIWSRLSETRWRGAFEAMLLVRPWWVFPAIALALLPVLLLTPFRMPRARRARAQYSMLLLMAVTGFLGMVVEIALLYWFQNVYGYVYAMIGLLTAMFMSGLALGALAPIRRTGLGALVPGVGALLFCGLVGGLGHVPHDLVPGLWLAIFLVLNLVGGVLVGAMFRTTASCAERLGWRPESSAGLLYGADLAGACVGSLAAGSILIPVLGVPSTCFVAAVLMVGALGGYVLSVGDA